jgi:hypothetical protein
MGLPALTPSRDVRPVLLGSEQSFFEAQPGIVHDPPGQIRRRLEPRQQPGASRGASERTCRRPIGFAAALPVVR